MKKRLRHRIALILFAFAVSIVPVTFTVAAGTKEGRVTQVVHNVQMLAPNAASRAASVNDNVRPGTAVRTGSDSRAELTFTNRTLTRLGASTVFSFGEGARDFDLASGSMLLYAPKNSGGARINTAAATVAGTSFTAMAEYHPRSGPKFIILEGGGSVSLKYHPGETRALHAGQMIIVRPGATKIPEPQDVDLPKLIKTSLLITKFPSLPSLNLILREAENQQDLPPSSHLIDPTGLNIRDQRAATEPSHF